MQLKLSCYQLKINGYIIFYARLKLTTRGKNYNRYSEDKVKRTKANHYKKYYQIIKKYGKKERNKTPKERENNEQNDNNVILLLYYFIYKSIKLPNQKAEWLNGLKKKKAEKPKIQY